MNKLLEILAIAVIVVGIVLCLMSIPLMIDFEKYVHYEYVVSFENPKEKTIQILDQYQANYSICQIYFDDIKPSTTTHESVHSTCNAIAYDLTVLDMY